MMDELTRLIAEAARSEWENHESITYLNRGSIPDAHRGGFVLTADHSGVLMLDAEGNFRVFLHDDQSEVALRDWMRRVATRELISRFPAIHTLISAPK